MILKRLNYFIIQVLLSRGKGKGGIMSTTKNTFKVTIGIPTLKTEKEVRAQIDEIHKFPPSCDYEVIASYIKQSAAKNRNWIIDNAKGDIVIQCDDDITGYFPGWADILVDALFFDNTISIISARPLSPSGGRAPILGDCNNPISDMEFTKCIHTEKTGLNVCGSATIAFWRECGVRFDEAYLGCTYEDTDFCMSMNKKYPKKQIVFANRCTIVHNEEKKGRGSSEGKRDYWQHNHNYFADKWGIRI
jgi:glycosyltransferase involved in cell wall biosynthesis